MQPSIRHADLFLPYRHLAWQMQSILTQTQQSSELNMACYTVSLFCPSTCLLEGPLSIGWPLAPPGGLVQPGHSRSQEDASRDRPGGAPLGPSQLRWRRDALQPPEVQRDHLARNTCAHIPDGGLRCISWNTRGLLGSPASSQHSRIRKHAYLARLARNNDIICLQETHGKDEFLQAIQVLVPQFRLFGTFIPNNVNASGSAIVIHKNLLPDGAIVTHVTTCQGRDHIVTVRPGDCVLVVVNVHVEPDLTLRGPRERLRRFCPHWPRYPEAFGVIIGDFNICEPEEGRFSVWRVPRGKRPFSVFFRMSLKLRNPTLQGKLC